eukprot:1602825-Rhodomonas_salina.6
MQAFAFAVRFVLGLHLISQCGSYTHRFEAIADGRASPAVRVDARPCLFVPATLKSQPCSEESPTKSRALKSHTPRNHYPKSRSE